MKSKYNNRSILSIIGLIGLLFFLFAFSQWPITYNLNRVDQSSIEKNNLSVPASKKQRGAHVFGIDDSTDFELFRKNNIEWITLVPWGYQEDFDSPFMKHHRGDSLQIVRRDSSWISRINLVQAAGFKVFFKPHVWIDTPTNGTWRSDIYPTTDENWELWKKSYRNFIIRYAKVAQIANAEMFCIGTEFTRLAIEKPIFWKKLIQEVRGIYDGKLTYAANWYKEYENLTFWRELDYIGIQAYFPLVSNEYPSIQQISKGWKKHLSTMKAIHKKYNRKIIFTELGYKSTADSAIEPWLWVAYSPDSKQVVSYETQDNCYKAFFKTVWIKDWFSGVHIWQLRGDYAKWEGHYHKQKELDFTPQGKPAENTIARGFK